jgi:hypothetical protein
MLSSPNVPLGNETIFNLVWQTRLLKQINSCTEESHKASLLLAPKASSGFLSSNNGNLIERMDTNFFQGL